jgi:hypothetical protein
MKRSNSGNLTVPEGTGITWIVSTKTDGMLYQQSKEKILKVLRMIILSFQKVLKMD